MQCKTETETTIILTCLGKLAVAAQAEFAFLVPVDMNKESETKSGNERIEPPSAKNTVLHIQRGKSLV
jgi:hypothetical protein